jgi:hypothetical protein
MEVVLMKKSIILGFTFFCLLYSFKIEASQASIKDNSFFLPFCKRMTAYASSSILGLMTGLVSGYVDKKIFPLLGFFGEPTIREAVLKDYFHSIEYWGIRTTSYQKIVMRYLAWFASWIGYLWVLQCDEKITKSKFMLQYGCE